MSTLHEDKYTFYRISLSSSQYEKCLRQKKRIEHQSTNCRFKNSFFENRTLYEIMWKNILQRGRRLTTIWRMHIACWITNATYTHSEYLLQQWLHERASMLRYRSTYIAFLLNLAHFVGLVWLLRLQISSSSAGISTVFWFMSVHLAASQLATATNKKSAALMFTNKYKKEI